MSRVYFHSPEGDAELRGSERAYAGSLTSSIACAAFDLHIERYRDDQPLKRVLPLESYLQTTDPFRFTEAFRTWLNVGMSDAYFVLGDHRIPSWDVVLNTITVIGNDALKFLARMHAQCEIHGYVEGPDRNWLAGIMRFGLEQKLYRKSAGWQGVIDLLESTDASPVVMSYSVCESFPNSGIANWIPWPEGVERDYSKLSDEQRESVDARSDEWYDLPDDERWRLAMDGLRAKELLRIQPDGFSDYGYGQGLSAFDVLEYLDGLSNP